MHILNILQDKKIHQFYQFSIALKDKSNGQLLLNITSTNIWAKDVLIALRSLSTRNLLQIFEINKEFICKSRIITTLNQLYILNRVIR
jgi:hypothetical protein